MTDKQESFYFGVLVGVVAIATMAICLVVARFLGWI
jgi:hypothetical protein